MANLSVKAALRNNPGLRAINAFVEAAAGDDAPEVMAARAAREQHAEQGRAAQASGASFEEELEELHDQARTSGLEARAERASAQRVEVVVRQREAAARTLVPFTQDAMTSEDAHAPLDPDRAARLRAHDHQLCLIADLAGCPADRDAAGSAEDMRDPPPAGAADAF